MLERIVVPAEMAGARGGYRKLKRIKGHDLGIVGVAVMKQGRPATPGDQLLLRRRPYSWTGWPTDDPPDVRGGRGARRHQPDQRRALQRGVPRVHGRSLRPPAVCRRCVMRVSVTVNGRIYERDVAEHRTLLAFLRDDLGLTGTKEGCAAGECGACTVFLNGETVNPAWCWPSRRTARTVQTIEGEAVDGRAVPIQQAAFARHHAVQCGFCTGGMVMSIRELLERNAEAGASGDQGRHRGQLLPLHRLPADHRGRTRRVRTADRRNEGGAAPCLRTSRRRHGRTAARGRREADRCRAVRERHGAARHAAREGQGQPARARADPAHRHVQGRAARRRARRARPARTSTTSSASTSSTRTSWPRTRCGTSARRLPRSPPSRSTSPRGPSS